MVAPSVTVLMTVYNGSKYLKDSVKSILNQTFRDFELLIVDDASTDDSLKMIQSYGDPRIVVHSNAVNLGQTKSLNVGLSLARGKYIARMDADDLAFPAWLESQSKFMDRHPQYAVASTKAAVIDSQNRIVRVLRTPASSGNIVLRSLTASPINHVGSLMRKEIVLDHGGYNERLTVPADYDLWSRLIRKGHRLSSTQAILIAIRFHEKSLSIQERGERDIGEMSEIMFENIKELTTFPVQKDDMPLYWRVNYHVECLDQAQFQHAVEMLDHVYQSIKPEIGIDRPSIDAARRKQMKVIYMKKIFACVKDGDVKGVRLISGNYLRRHGWLTVFSLVWVTSFFGMIILRILPAIYEKILRVGTKVVLKNKTGPVYLH